jgi:hypothetical protein
MEDWASITALCYKAVKGPKAVTEEQTIECLPSLDATKSPI